MAQVSGTFDTYDSGRNRETLSDVISMITPEETPFYTLVGTESIDGVLPQWNLDALRTPSTANAFRQADTYTYNSITATTKVGNYTQIFRDSYIVAKTQEVVSKAGPKSDFNREKLKALKAVKTDIEVTALANQASLAGDSGTPPTMGSLRAWIATNDSMGATGSSGGYSGGVVAVASNGTQRSFTKALLDNNIQTVYVAGGNPSILMLSPYLKTVFSGFMSDSNVAAFRTNLSGDQQGTIYGAADRYISDFGPIDVVPNRQMPRVSATLCRNAYLLEPSKVSFGILRPLSAFETPEISDAKSGVVIGELTLIVKNEKALGVIADLFGATAST